MSPRVEPAECPNCRGTGLVPQSSSSAGMIILQVVVSLWIAVWLSFWSLSWAMATSPFIFGILPKFIRWCKR